MANFQEYMDLTEASYASRTSGQPNVPGWILQKWEWATWYGDGFQGGIFESPSEIVVAFSGTKGSLKTAPISQNTGNARIGVNVIPNLAGSAMAMVRWAQKQAINRPVSLVGHSLGGGLAQVVGNWSGLPFISFNGPGMKTHLKMSAFNIFKPQQALRSALSRNTDDSVGLCFTVKGDFTGEFGAHVGHEIVLAVTSEPAKHSMNAIWSGLNAKGWRSRSPRDVYSIWPAAPSGRSRAGARGG